MNDHAKVLFFANLREKVGVREISIEFARGTTIAEIKERLVGLYPVLKPHMETIIVAMNHEFAFDESIVPDGVEIAIFPPVSGGAKELPKLPVVIAIVVDEIDINSIVEKISSDSTGAACVFSGIVRGVTKRKSPHQTDELEYEAYREMAESKMRQISAEIRSRWNEIEGIAIVQRVGKLFPCEISVVIACTASHRDSGIFEAARYGIDRLKEIVPIWKKEIGSNGEEWIEGDYLPRPGE